MKVEGKTIFRRLVNECVGLVDWFRSLVFVGCVFLVFRIYFVCGLTAYYITIIDFLRCLRHSTYFQYIVSFRKKALIKVEHEKDIRKKIESH